MTLSEDDQNSLDRVEISLLADDPHLATRLDMEAVRRSLRQRRRLAHYELWIGLVIMLIGADVAQGVLSIGAMYSYYGLALLVWSTTTIVRCDRAVTPSTG